MAAAVGRSASRAACGRKGGGLEMAEVSFGPVAGRVDCGCIGARGGGGGGTSRPGPVFVSWLSGGAYGTGRPGAIGGRLIGGRLMSVEGGAGGLGMPDRHGVGRALGSAGGGVALPGSSGIMRRRGVVPMQWMDR